MRSFALLISVGFFLLSPGFACGTDEPQFQYGASEMRAVVEGNWALTVTPPGASAMQVVVQVAQASGTASVTPPSRGGLVRPAYACGTRTLVRSAGACTEDSQMPLTASYVSGDNSFATVPMSGQFMVHGLTFASGDLELTIGSYQISFQVKADGSLGDPHLSILGGATGTLVVTRG